MAALMRPRRDVSAVVQYMYKFGGAGGVMRGGDYAACTAEKFGGVMSCHRPPVIAWCFYSVNRL